MRRAAAPQVWFSLALLVLTAGGALLLAHPAVTSIDARDLDVFWSRHYWMSAFNAVSAACGVGLLHGDIDAGFSEMGRWVLTGIGLGGAVLYLLAAVQLFRKFGQRAAADASPSAARVLVVFLAAQALFAVVMIILRDSASERTGVAVSVRQAIAAFASLGWAEGDPRGTEIWVIAVVSLMGALGWPLWMLWSQRTRRLVSSRRVGGMAALYLGFLVAAAALISAFEMPRRAPVVGRVQRERTATTSFASRFGENLPRTVAASGAGIQFGGGDVQPIAEGSKLVLAGVVLAGGIGGGVGGGIKWPLLVIALAAFGRSLRRQETCAGGTVRPAATIVVTMLLLTLVTATGLLLIETATGSQFKSPPTLGDALLEAASAVGGAGLSAGVTEAVTGPHLSGGMHSPGDKYQYGTAWLMLAMLAGRLMPLWLLARFAQSADASKACGPVI